MFAQMDNMVNADAVQWLSVLVAGAGLLVSVLVIVGSAVWVVASLRGSAQSLGRSIDSLRTMVERLDTVVSDSGRRIVELERKMAGGRKSEANSGSQGERAPIGP